MLASFQTYIFSFLLTTLLFSLNHHCLPYSPLTTALVTAAPIKETFAPPTLTREWTEEIQPQETAFNWGTRGRLGGRSGYWLLGGGLGGLLGGDIGGNFDRK